MGALIEVLDTERVRYLTLNRADRFNALNSAVLTELRELIVDAAADESVGCLVIRGAGDRAFCAGADLDELRGLTIEAAHAFIRRGQQTMAAVEASPIPVLAAVDGYALGGGLELMLACHLVVASDRSSFGLPEAKIGCQPGFGGTQRLLTATGKAPALYLMLTGERVDAGRAWDMGLLSVPPVPPDDLTGTVGGLAQRVAAGSRSGIGNLLEAARRAYASPALEHEAALAAIAIASPDGQEGIRAFAERRPPAFGTRHVRGSTPTRR
jgi:enoyl-CoA hydratase